MARKNFDKGELEKKMLAQGLEITLAEILEAIKHIFAYLEASEAQVIEIIEHAKRPASPPKWEGTATTDGSLEFGLVLYWVDNPPEIIEEILDEDIILLAIWAVLSIFFLPKTKITPEDYAFLIEKAETVGVTGPDGTIYGEGVYEMLDPKWLYAALNYLVNLVEPGKIASFGDNPQTLTLNGKTKGEVSIAVIGDWGTGEYGDDGGPAKAIMKQIRDEIKPDYIIHLGDVYYAGTDQRTPPGEERDNFLKMWGESDPGSSFALNSNHEMYGACKGYFDVALGAETFESQKKTSYFCLTYGDFAILGLDSAYYSQSKLYMEGNLGDSGNRQQEKFISGLDLDGKKVIVMTHHTGVDLEGAKRLDLWGEVYKALGRDPDYWYWGHIHDGIVYSDKSMAGKTTKARCIGHSAIPFGEAWGLQEDDVKDNIVFFSNTQVSKGSIKRLNGFAVITLHEDGTINEAIYDQGNPTPTWTA